jgi:ascorbate-specific PTS system EIIC-type component UlaA
LAAKEIIMHSIPTEEQIDIEYEECMDHLKGNNTNCYWAISTFIGNNIKNTEDLKIPFLDRISRDNKISSMFCLCILILFCAMVIIIIGLLQGLFTEEHLTTFVGWLIGVGGSGSLFTLLIIKFWSDRKKP